jgi:AAHS family 3-hydroxyphenylpropionic acid transporter
MDPPQPYALQPGVRELHTVRVWILCALVILLEGFDLQAAGVAAPRLAPAFHLSVVQLGWFLGSSSVGIFLASALGGMCADRFGRRPVVAGGVALFGLFSLTTLGAHGLGWLLAARFCTGLGLGLAMPAVIAMASDHSPDHLKKRAVGFIYCAIPLGALLSSAVLRSAWAGQDWRPVFLVGGLAPLVVAPVLLWLLPEAPARAAGPGGGPPARSPFRAGLFGQGHAAVTACLWLGTFGTLLVVYLLLGWMPSLLIALGLQRSQVQSTQMAFNLGASLGAAASGILLDRKWLVATPVVNYLGLAACLALLGFLPVGFHGALALAAVVGATATCGQAAIFALAPLCYSAEVRTTGVGATVSAGRFGTIAGPLMAGSLLGVGHSASEVLIVLIPITLVSGLFVVGVARLLGRAGDRNQKLLVAPFNS